MGTKIRTIHFEDHGQDFLEWDLDADNVVIACRPCQGWVWIGNKVMNKAIKPGCYLKFQSEHIKAKCSPSSQLVLKYKVIAIEEKEDATHV